MNTSNRGLRLLYLAAGLCLLAVGCDRKLDRSAESESAEPEESAKQGVAPEDGEESDEGEHGHPEEELRLGLKMQDIGHRFSAIWYAGSAGRSELLEYQVHELEETVEQIEHADIEEHGLDVGEQLEARVLSKLEDLVEKADAGEREAFREGYRGIIQECNSCHAETEHDFLDVTVPRRNPYPNLELGEPDGED